MPVYSMNDRELIDVLQDLSNKNPEGLWVTLTFLRDLYPEKLQDMNLYAMYKSLDKIMQIKSSSLFDFVIIEKRKVKNQYSKYVNGYRVVKRHVVMRHMACEAEVI